MVGETWRDGGRLASARTRPSSPSDFLRGLSGLNIVGADVVEVAPAYDHADTTALAAATVVFEIMGLLTNRQTAAEPRRADFSLATR